VRKVNTNGRVCCVEDSQKQSEQNSARRVRRQGQLDHPRAIGGGVELTTFPDPLVALQTVFTNYVNYQSDDATPVTENVANNGLIVEIFPQGKVKHKVCPYIEVGPIQHTTVTPQNIGNSPNSRWLHKHFIECHIDTQTYQSPNISGYDAVTRIWESVRQVLVQNQTTVDGSGNWLFMKLSAGPLSGPDTTITPDRYDYVFVVELSRSVVN